FWAIFGIITGFQVWISMITHGHSVPRLIGFFVVVWEAWLGATAIIVWLAKRWPVIPPSRTNILVHCLAACAIAVVHGVFWAGLLVAMRPYDRMTVEPSRLNLAEMLFTRLPLEFTLYFLVLGGAYALDFYGRYREREKLLSEARLHALELQIQPHFLFNTLNAISSLVRNRRNDEAVTMMAGLSELLRYTLDHAGTQCVALEDEVAVLRRYLEIQRTRFSDRMTFEIDVDPAVRRAAVPVLMLQPLAENAVRHGIAPAPTPGVVEVRAFRDDGRLRIEMFNSGTLREEKEMRIGLRNTVERLDHLYGRDYRFDLSNQDGGVLASLSIPWSEVA
ncbi:MAG: sensor histidine kinase, partial [Thermoanaerobaculia bacterium]